MKPEDSTKLSLDTRISRVNAARATLRGYDLTDLIGELTFSETLLLAVSGERPRPAAGRALDAVFVSFIDHGFLPGTLVSRIAYQAAPNYLQGALAAGILSTSSAILETMEECAQLLSEIVGDIRGGAAADQAVTDNVSHRLRQGKRIPAVGHGLHKDGDPRAVRLLEFSRREGVALTQIDLLEQVAERTRQLTGRNLLPNVAGAMAAVLLGLGIEPGLQRGVALIGRAVGLFAHIGEEMSFPVVPEISRSLRSASSIEDE